MSVLPGLVSVTFRQLDPKTVVGLAVENGLHAIEWGADIHVPLGDLRRAREVAALSADAGVDVVSYGSYHKAGIHDKRGFGRVLETAVALGAPSIRIWAGTKASKDVDPQERRAVIDGIVDAAEAVAAVGLALNIEYHPGTLSDSPQSTIDIIEMTSFSHVHTYWQPKPGAGVEESVSEVSMLLPYLATVHVFHWAFDKTRLPLLAGEVLWRPVLQLLQGDVRSRYALLEFVAGDDPAALVNDAETLRKLVSHPPESV